ncbi:MAG: phospholipid carrier-dependent glycosyltransferase [Phycisphaeraceae bacterium]
MSGRSLSRRLSVGSERAGATGAGGEPPQRVALPDERYSRWRVWLGLLLTVLVCLPPLLVSLSAADVTGGEEAATLLRSRETWQRHHAGEPLAYLIPTANRQQMLREPPMAVWLNMAAWAGLDPATASPETLMHRARLLSVAMALLAVLATYWAGMSVGGGPVAWLAAVALGCSVLFIYQARTATPDSILLGFATLSMAAALWAMRPLKPTAWVGRRMVGWLISGIALAAAILTSGFIAAVFVLPPLIAAILLTPRRRVGNTFGLVFALSLGVVAAVPWYLYVLDPHRVPDAWGRIVGHVSMPEHLFVLTWSHGRVLATFFPWIVFLIGALCQPFLRADSERRRQLLIAWSWFVLVFVAFSIPAAAHPRYLVPILPAVALMVGQLWAYHTALASRREHDPGVNWLRLPHWLMLIGMSVGGAWFMLNQQALVEAGHLGNIELAPVATWLVLLTAVVLLTIAVSGAVMHLRWQPRQAACATVAWMLVAGTLGFHAHAHAPYRQYDHVTDARELAVLAADHELMYLHDDGDGPPLNNAFLFYLARAVPPVAPSQLDQLVAQEKLVYVVAERDGDVARSLQQAGFSFARFFEDGGRPRALYRNHATEDES